MCKSSSWLPSNSTEWNTSKIQFKTHRPCTHNEQASHSRHPLARTDKLVCFPNFTTFVVLKMYSYCVLHDVGGRTCAHMWRSQRNSVRLVLSLHLPVDPGDWTQVGSLASASAYYCSSQVLYKCFSVHKKAKSYF